MSELIHATAVALRGRGGWRGVLLAGASGMGKSGLALRLLEQGGRWRLVGDDYVQVWASGGRLYARAAERIAGRIEARGVGIVAACALELAPIALIVDGVADELDRLPPGTLRRIAGVDIPSLALDLTHPTAPAKVAAALSAL